MSQDTDNRCTVAARSTGPGLANAVRGVFDATLAPSLLRGADVFVKVNGIDFKPFSYTDPEVLDAALAAIRDSGARSVSVMENCTQGNFTRLVFRETGFAAVCRRHGARRLYLDEGRSVPVMLETMGYEVGVNSRIAHLARDPGSAVYVNIPKLKTHSMSTVTLGIKNQLGLIDQQDRIRDHNFRLHAKLVDIFRLFRPTLTLVDAVHAVYNGHYPAEAHLDRCVERLDIVVGGTDTLAVDTVAAGILGYSADEVEHLRLAREAGLGCGDRERITVDGALPEPARRYNCDILMDFPEDVAILRGTERCCKEGCRKNTETLIQTLYRDYGGRGGFTVIMGKGFDRERIARIEGPVHVAGTCAIDETMDILEARPGRALLTSSHGCNNLAATIDAVTAHMRVSVIGMAPHPLASTMLLLAAKMRGSRARVPRII